MFCLFVCLCTMCVPGALRGQKRVLNNLLDLSNSHELPCMCWELGSSGRAVGASNTEPSLQSIFVLFKRFIFNYVYRVSLSIGIDMCTGYGYLQRPELDIRSPGAGVKVSVKN